MKKALFTVLAAALIISSCKMENPFFSESSLQYGAPDFSKIKIEHYQEAFEKGLEQVKADIDAIVANPKAPTFKNTILALEHSGEILNRVSNIFYNVNEADTSDQMQEIAEQVAPIVNEASLYSSLNAELFAKVKKVYDERESLNLDAEDLKLLEKTYKGFVRGGANLSDEDKKLYAQLSDSLSLKTLTFSKNALAAQKAYVMNLTDKEDLAGLPDYVVNAAAETAASKGLEGWAFTLDGTSYGPFMKFSDKRDLRKKIYLERATMGTKGENSNLEVIKEIVSLRTRIAQLLGYETFADYALENRMAKTVPTVENFIETLLEPSLKAAKAEVKTLYEYAKAHGFEDDQLYGWDFSYWSEKYSDEMYSISEAVTKPYFKLEDCIDAVFMLAGRLYGLQFEPISLPTYHPDVMVYDVKDANSNHKALFYADFFPRDSKRAGAWMTSFSEQYIKDGVEHRPIVSIVANLSKPTATEPSLLTHDEFVTFLHEFGHSLHGMLAEGKYGSLTGTSVAWDFVELPSQIMENWAYEPEYLNLFAKHYQTGEPIPAEIIAKIRESKNYLAAYYQVGQLRYGTLDMAWYTLKEVPKDLDPIAFEKAAVKRLALLPGVEGSASSPTFSHIFAGGYSAGYYSYKWAEVLEADAFSLFEEKGIFNTEVSESFRKNILSSGGVEEPDVIYRRFRGHDPEPEALLRKLDIIK